MVDDQSARRQGGLSQVGGGAPGNNVEALEDMKKRVAGLEQTVRDDVGAGGKTPRGKIVVDGAPVGKVVSTPVCDTLPHGDSLCGERACDAL